MERLTNFDGTLFVVDNPMTSECLLARISGISVASDPLSSKAAVCTPCLLLRRFLIGDEVITNAYFLLIIYFFMD